MKTLYLIRHAKSDWSSAATTDFERPLNKRGLKAAPLMGARLKSQACAPDLLLSSPARRAHQTAKLVATEIGYPLEEIEYIAAIYAADLATLIALIRQLPQNATRVMLIGHNPEVSALGKWFCSAAPDWLPTCGLLELKLKNVRWEGIQQGCGQLLRYDFPKRPVDS